MLDKGKRSGLRKAKGTPVKLSIRGEEEGEETDWAVLPEGTGQGKIPKRKEGTPPAKTPKVPSTPYVFETEDEEERAFEEVAGEKSHDGERKGFRRD